MGLGVLQCTLLFMSDSFRLVWGHLVHFANCQFYYLRLCSSPNFYPISFKLYTRYLINRAIQATFWAICQKLQKLWHFEISLTQDHMQLEITKCYFSHNFHWSPSKLYENIGYHGKSVRILE